MQTPGNIRIEKINPGNRELIDLITAWYIKEWNIPAELTQERAKNFLSNGVPFQFILKQDDIPVATGGLYTDVGLLQVYPEYKKYPYWLALIYTVPEKRKQGLAGILCKEIEKEAKKLNIHTLHLHTFTAEKLYLEMNWKPVTRVLYKDHDTVIMKKEL